MSIQFELWFTWVHKSFNDEDYQNIHSPQFWMTKIPLQNSHWWTPFFFAVIFGCFWTTRVICHICPFLPCSIRAQRAFRSKLKRCRSEGGNPDPWEMIQFWRAYFSKGWKNHQLGNDSIDVHLWQKTRNLMVICQGIRWSYFKENAHGLQMNAIVFLSCSFLFRLESNYGMRAICMHTICCVLHAEARAVCRVFSHGHPSQAIQGWLVLHFTTSPGNQRLEV